MAELDLFEARLSEAVHAFADRAATGVDASAVAARAVGRRRAGTFAWLGHPLPVPAWIILLGGLLLAALLGATMIGGAFQDDRGSKVPPSSPGPTPTAVATDETDVLVTARAHALPPAATCPSGSDLRAGSEGPGLAAERYCGCGLPGLRSAVRSYRRRRHLLHERRSPDVDLRRLCQHVVTHGPGAEPAPAGSRVRRRFGSDDRVRAWRRVCLRARRDVSYDLDADRWERGSDGPVPTTVSVGSTTPWSYLKAAYHDPSGLVVVYDGTRIWAYDVETDHWYAIRQQESPWDAGRRVRHVVLV